MFWLTVGILISLYALFVIGAVIDCRRYYHEKKGEGKRRQT